MDVVGCVTHHDHGVVSAAALTQWQLEMEDARHAYKQCSDDEDYYVGFTAKLNDDNGNDNEVYFTLAVTVDLDKNRTVVE